MNAVVLLVWLAGADGAAPAAKPTPAPVHVAPAPIYAAPAYSSSCNTCCDSGGHSMFGKLRGLFHRSCDDGCKPAGCGNHGLFHQRHQDNCGDSGGHRLFGFLNRCGHDNCGDPCCKERVGHKLRDRFHGIFRRHDDCCQPSNCCNQAAPAVIHPQAAPAVGHPHAVPVITPKSAAEPLGAPKKKLPDAPAKDVKPKSAAQLSPAPATLTLESPVLVPGR